MSGSRWTTRSASLVGDYPRELVGDAKPALRLGEQHDPAIGTDPPAVKSGGDLLAADRLESRTAEGYRRSWRMWRASIPAKGWIQQPNPTPDQKLTLLPPPQIRPLMNTMG
jgi:hypothetical protein